MEYVSKYIIYIYNIYSFKFDFLISQLDQILEEDTASKIPSLKQTAESQSNTRLALRVGPVTYM